MAAPPLITAAVEGTVDEAVLRTICRAAGTDICDVYGKSGKSFVLARLAGYNHSARHRHWAVLLDLDNDFPCPPPALAVWLPHPAALMSLRIAVREVEAWLIADAERIAEFLEVRRGLVPSSPDDVNDPKREIVNLARKSASREVREDIVPHPSSGQEVGPAYTSRMIEFLTHGVHAWRLNVAAQNSPSLAGCVHAIRRLARLPFPAEGQG